MCPIMAHQPWVQLTAADCAGARQAGPEHAHSQRLHPDRAAPGQVCPMQQHGPRLQPSFPVLVVHSKAAAWTQHRCDLATPLLQTCNSSHFLLQGLGQLIHGPDCQHAEPSVTGSPAFKHHVTGVFSRPCRVSQMPVRWERTCQQAQACPQGGLSCSPVPCSAMRGQGCQTLAIPKIHAVMTDMLHGALQINTALSGLDRPAAPRLLRESQVLDSGVLRQPSL